MKFTSKTEFLEATELQWNLMWELVDGLSGKSKSEKASKQILAHLYSWHRLLIGWIKTGEGSVPELPAKGYNWQQTRQLNAKLDRETAPLDLASVKRRLKLSHNRVIKIVESLSEQEFLRTGHFEWTGKNAFSSYVVPNTFSHYRWAIRKIKKLK